MKRDGAMNKILSMKSADFNKWLEQGFLELESDRLNKKKLIQDIDLMIRNMQVGQSFVYPIELKSVVYRIKYAHSLGKEFNTYKINATSRVIFRIK